MAEYGKQADDRDGARAKVKKQRPEACHRDQGNTEELDATTPSDELDSEADVECKEGEGETTFGSAEAKVVSEGKVKGAAELECADGEDRLHNQRHAFIVNWLKSVLKCDEAPYIVGAYDVRMNSAKFVRLTTITGIDYGCAQGVLSVKMHHALPQAQLVACEANATYFNWRTFRKNRDIRTVLCNLLYPPIGTSLPLAR